MHPFVLSVVMVMFQASQIAHLVRDYMLELQMRYMLAPSESQQRMSRAVDIDQLDRHNTMLQWIE